MRNSWKLRRTSRLATLVAGLSALLLALPAQASSGIDLIDFTNTPTRDGQPVGTVTEANTTINYDWLEIDMDGGIVVVADSDPNSPVNDDKVGEVDLTARFPAFFCFNNNYNFGIYWVSPVSAGAPSGTIAEMRIDAPTGDIPAYVIEDASGDHSILVDMTGTDTCTSNPAAEMIVTTYKRVDNGGNTAVVARNSSTEGTYTITTTIDAGGTNHSDSDTYSVT